VARARRGGVSTWWTSSEQLAAAAGAPASASATECALAMLLHHASGGDLEVSRRVVGAEWWVQHRSLSAPKGFHFDVDQEQQRRGGALRSPALSSILYLTDAGGPTLILDQVATICSWSGHVLLSPPEPAEADVIHPLANRFVLFRAACLHGCLPHSAPAAVWRAQRRQSSQSARLCWSTGGLGSALRRPPVPRHPPPSSTRCGAPRRRTMPRPLLPVEGRGSGMRQWRDRWMSAT